ncbi:N-acetylmuramoyl-L-alanine amidase [Nocardioides jishulii]|nr:N-acetylmuramoyl-L-alanine amidase [Nocardioides jishulii]
MQRLPAPPSSRRPRSAATVALVLAAAGLTVPVSASSAARPAPTRSASPAVHATDPSGLGPSRQVSLAPVGGGVREVRAALPAGTSTLRSDRFTMVGATWTGAGEPRVQFSLRARDGWGGWRDLPVLHDGPTAGAEGDGVRGTDLVWVGASSSVRVRTLGQRPQGLRLLLLDTSGRPAADPAPEPTPSPEPTAEPTSEPTSAPTTEPTAAPTAQPTEQAAPRRSAPPPRMRPRKKWGAKEKWRTSPPVMRRTLKQVHVHHTASSNSYGRDDVPGILRGFYRYHTKSLGWSDIGYNVLVDRFGRAWVGRYGGDMVQGAHTLGFNHNSIGVAVIGDYRKKKPTRPVIRTVARVAAWQLDKNERRAVGKVKVVSKGSDRFRRGKKVTLPVIDGHLHTNQTACPGRQLVKVLPGIRSRAQYRIRRH